ncbi:MAG: AAA family ATPase [Hydrogenibacillus schlegelii]|uniref:AAA family ATPase n=1 Tax=Hydrogenibacillus schlegelii TaxID=1484 RepID=A0A947GAH0_HYDSH|nr:AAA family ATPase [Hydrogenibacillus schlegelii]
MSNWDYDWLDDLTQKPRQRKINYTEADLERDLAEIIGLENVKNTIRDIYYTVRANRERQASGLETSGQLLHMMFYGNPGTGKTTVARLVGRMFREMGVLSRGHFVEVEASDLIAGYVGQTGPKTQAKIREALGGVLFIDEAYALVPEDDTRNSFGPEAIAVLIKAMEDHRDNLCVILAGYEDEMKRLLKVNPGLRSRIPFVLHFPDYTPPELLRIFVAEATKRQYRIERDGGEYLLELFTTYQANMRELGNGRFARNVLERAILAQSRRLGALGRRPAPDELTLLTVDDLRAWEEAEAGRSW